MKFVTGLTDFPRPNLTQFWWKLFFENTSKSVKKKARSDGLIQIFHSISTLGGGGEAVPLRKFLACIDRD